jgi:hypothetical protein
MANLLAILVLTVTFALIVLPALGVIFGPDGQTYGEAIENGLMYAAIIGIFVCGLFGLTWAIDQLAR